MKNNINDKIDALTDAIEKLLTREVAPIAPVAPVAPVLPIVQPNTGDHDLLTKLDTKVDQIQLDVNTLKNQGNLYITLPQHQELIKVINDHETRIRNGEAFQQGLIGKISVVAGGISLLTTVIMAFILSKLGI